MGLPWGALPPHLQPKKPVPKGREGREVITAPRPSPPPSAPSSGGGGGSFPPPPSVPGDPGFISVTPPPEPTPEPIVKELEGIHVDVKYRTPQGNIKSFTTKRFDPSKVSGEIMSIRVSSPYVNIRYDPFYDVSKQVIKRTPLEAIRETVTWKTIKPTLTPEMEYILGHQAATGQEPYLQKKYEKMYEEAIITGKTAKLEEFWKSGFERMRSEEQLIYAKTFQDYKPPKPIKKDEPSLIGKIGAYIFMPFGERIEYTTASLTETRYKPGTLTPVEGATLLESPGMIDVREKSEQIFFEQWKKGDWAGILGRSVQSPVVLPFLMYGAGAGMGALKATAWAAKPIVIQSPMGPTAFSITRGTAIEATVGGYFGYEAIKGGVKAAEADKLSEYLTGIAVTMPFVILPYKYGYRSGMGFVQKKAAMAKVTDPQARVQQQALYDAMRITRKLEDPRYDVKPYDITRVKKVGPYEAKQLTTYIKSLRAKYIHKTAIGGSTAMEIQMPLGTFRAGGYPKRLFDIVTRRQQLAFRTGLQKGTQVKPIKTGGVPGDIDLLLRGLLAKEKSVTVSMLKRLDIHVHKGRVGQYYGFGEITYPSTKGFIIDPFLKGKSIKVKLLGPREQFMRTSISILPSEQPIKGYRAYKDVPTWYDVGELLSFQKGGTKLRIAMDKFLYPEKYPTPKVTLSERFIKYIGGAVEPKYIETIPGYIEPVYPEYIYPKAYVPYTLATSGFPVTPYAVPYETPSYVPTMKIDYYIGKQPSLPKAGAYPTDPYKKKPITIDKFISGYLPSYPSPPDYPLPYVPTLVPPDYPLPYVPTLVPPDYPPPYTPTDYPPPYPPPYIPDYPPPYSPPPPTKQPPRKQPKKKREPPMELGQGFAPFVKDRVYVKGKKVYKERYIRMGKTPLSKTDAMALGGFLTDESVARTFKVKPVKGEIKPLEMNIPHWSMLIGKFYKKDKRMIEKTDYAIDSKGELEGITAKGLLARMERKSKKPIVSKISRIPRDQKTRAKGSVETVYNDVMDNMNNAFDRMNRNMRKGGI